MKSKIYILTSIVFCLVCLFAGCTQEDLLGKMKKIVPIVEGARVLESKLATEKMSVIIMEVEVSKTSQKDLLDFYKDTMTKQGWELKSLKDYGKNGSVMELVKDDLGTLSVVTIMKKVKKTGIIPVTLNLTIK